MSAIPPLEWHQEYVSADGRWRISRRYGETQFDGWVLCPRGGRPIVVGMGVQPYSVRVFPTAAEAQSHAAYVEEAERRGMKP